MWGEKWGGELGVGKVNCNGPRNPKKFSSPLAAVCVLVIFVVLYEKIFYCDYRFLKNLTKGNITSGNCEVRNRAAAMLNPGLALYILYCYFVLLNSLLIK